MKSASARRNFSLNLPPETLFPVLHPPGVICTLTGLIAGRVNAVNQRT